MIFIKSKKNEPTTDDVVLWLAYFGQTVQRVDDRVTNFDEICITNADRSSSVQYSDSVVRLSELGTFWYRKRGGHTPYDTPSLPEKVLNQTNLIGNISNEWQELENFIFYNLSKSAFNLGNYGKGNLNKLIVLDQAERLCISVPKYIITNSKVKLQEFLLLHKKVVLKPMSNVTEILTEHQEFLQYTFLVGQEQMAEIPEKFFPSLFQQYIEKEVEIRSFFISGKFYSMAMFTQKNAQTRVDFRRYDKSNPARHVPFALPALLEDKLRTLFVNLELNTGSIDLLLDKKGNFFFLEINPVGQFNMVSEHCNYYLEKIIAQKLMYV